MEISLRTGNKNNSSQLLSDPRRNNSLSEIKECLEKLSKFIGTDRSVNDKIALDYHIKNMKRKRICRKQSRSLGSPFKSSILGQSGSSIIHVNEGNHIQFLFNQFAHLSEKFNKSIYEKFESANFNLNLFEKFFKKSVFKLEQSWNSKTRTLRNRIEKADSEKKNLETLVQDLETKLKRLEEKNEKHKNALKSKDLEIKKLNFIIDQSTSELLESHLFPIPNSNLQEIAACIKENHKNMYKLVELVKKLNPSDNLEDLTSSIFFIVQSYSDHITNLMKTSKEETEELKLDKYELEKHLEKISKEKEQLQITCQEYALQDTSSLKCTIKNMEDRILSLVKENEKLKDFDEYKEQLDIFKEMNVLQDQQINNLLEENKKLVLTHSGEHFDLQTQDLLTIVPESKNNKLEKLLEKKREKNRLNKQLISLLKQEILDFRTPQSNKSQVVRACNSLLSQIESTDSENELKIIFKALGLTIQEITNP